MKSQSSITALKTDDGRVTIATGERDEREMFTVDILTTDTHHLRRLRDFVTRELDRRTP